MNALFYAIAFNKNIEQAEADIKKFLELAKVPNHQDYYDFKIYTEFSLSEFGSPDLVIFARNKRSYNREVFFVEAKASCCDKYNLDDQKTLHQEYMLKGDHDNGHASNLFFQLRLKNYYYQRFCEGKKAESIIFTNDEHDRIRKTKGHNRGIGSNPIVHKFVDKFKDCNESHYIAIIPKQTKGCSSNPRSFFELKIYFVTWEDICEKFEDYESFIETIRFNQGVDHKIKSEKRVKSQILNNPLPKKE